jgi:hypothetical protein
MLQERAPRLDPRDQHYWIPGPHLPSHDLEAMRFALYRDSIAFLCGGDAAQPGANRHGFGGQMD